MLLQLLPLLSVELMVLLAQTHPPAEQGDPLISKGLQSTVLVGVALLAIAIVTIVGMISPRVEHAIMTAVFLSLVLIGLFLSLSHS